MGGYNSHMRSRWVSWFIGGALTLTIVVGLYQIPAVKYRLGWRIDAAAARMRGWLHPGDVLPTPAGAEVEEMDPTETPLPPTAPSTPYATLAPSPTPTPLPSEVRFEAPTWEKQDWNNCGPATLALGLRFYGWGGDQFDISNLLKPDRGDRNVNIDELAFYVRNRAGWLNAEIRVAGTLETIKRFLAAGYPVIVEKGYIIESEGPDAGWAGHYLLVTGYDDAQNRFITQDSFVGPDETVDYAMLDEGWQAFNRAYMIVFPVDDQEQIENLLGPDVDLDVNRERALQVSLAEVEADPEDAFAWFNLGTNHLYFESYDEAAQAYDRALNLGLPWRFTRYQFGPYIAYFNVSRFQDVIDLADATLYRTNKAEESMLWRGWARYRLGDLVGAIEDFRAALEVNPYYLDAQYALDYLGAAR
jgi:tetratricopeptide (TPR) repeat protein